MMHAASVQLCFVGVLPLLQTQILGRSVPSAPGRPLAAAWGQRAASPLRGCSGLWWVPAVGPIPALLRDPGVPPPQFRSSLPTPKQLSRVKMYRYSAFLVDATDKMCNTAGG